MKDPSEDPERLHRKAVATSIVRGWLERNGTPCPTCRALTDLYLESADAIYRHNNRIEDNVRIEGSDLLMQDAFGDDGPIFRRVFPEVRGTYYRSADGQCPDCGTAWQYGYDAHGGWSGVLRTVGAR